ncbi:uncharacterized protein LOC103180660 isoform X1 [Callorhinchus milii]|uniref:uncharacterized protein LOC103180660 isoform X1 n=1 Tax=Callorhinchus milii TaxID=7868 RepID=UPI0004571901|nr:uncharacterized protein LOC103180660 isoform X1 [Callorhinchus milii]|eukprot:gi/632958080/ref/XP_007894832.1/ PREDICTED: uncharacterized protein LOC103180660 isoform X2 [Callorhinchus milii]
MSSTLWSWCNRSAAERIHKLNSRLKKAALQKERKLVTEESQSGTVKTRARLCDRERCKYAMAHDNTVEAKEQGNPSTVPAVSFSKLGVRFDLPMDLQLLEGMSPSEYLRSHCRCDQDLCNLFKAAFTQHDKDKDGLINVKELEQALLSVYTLHKDHTNRLWHLLKADDKLQVDLNLFVAVGSLTSRILEKEPRNSAIKPESIGGKEFLEKADFFNLEWRLSETRIGADLRNLLFYLL